jgi:hypothetical protein
MHVRFYVSILIVSTEWLWEGVCNCDSGNRGHKRQILCSTKILKPVASLFDDQSEYLMTVRTCQDKGTKLPRVEQTLRRREFKKQQNCLPFWPSLSLRQQVSVHKGECFRRQIGTSLRVTWINISLVECWWIVLGLVFQC